MINDQNKSKVFLLIIGILLITNIAMLFFFLQKKTPPRREGRPDIKAQITNVLKNDIGFTDQQLAQYDSLSKRHREKMGRQFDSARSKKTAQFTELVAGNFSDSVILKLADESAGSQRRMEISMFNHIRNIRRIATPDQQFSFDSTFGKVFTRRSRQQEKSKKN